MSPIGYKKDTENTLKYNRKDYRFNWFYWFSFYGKLQVDISDFYGGEGGDGRTECRW